MNMLIEQALQLPKEEKLELYYALQEDLDDEVGEEELTKEQWEEVEKRYSDIKSDPSQFMSGDEFLKKMTTLNNELRGKRS